MEMVGIITRLYRQTTRNVKVLTHDGTELDDGTKHVVGNLRNGSHGGLGSLDVFVGAQLGDQRHIEQRLMTDHVTTTDFGFV